VTPQTKDLLDLFFENYNRRSPERFRELCVWGTPGCGKSCAAKILEGEIRRRIPKARVLFTEQITKSTFCSRPPANFQRSERAQEPRICCSGSIGKHELPTYGNMAGRNLYVVLVASANLDYFSDCSSNRSALQHVHRFPDGVGGEPAKMQLQTRKRKQ